MIEDSRDGYRWLPNVLPAEGRIRAGVRESPSHIVGL
jgi:hypothetical protein